VTRIVSGSEGAGIPRFAIPGLTAWAGGNGLSGRGNPTIPITAEIADLNINHV
jgi:hypothetical protein